MKLWTILTKQSWLQLQEHETLKAKQHHIESDFLESYRWMTTQARHRIGSPPEGCEFPIWAWYQWQSHRKRKPDLRYTCHLPPGTEGFRLEIEIDESKVLLSDFDLWHFALNYWYLPESEEDGDEFDAKLEELGLSPYETKPLPHPEFDERIRNSWLRIFDLDWSAENIASPRKEKSIQAVFWELHREQVKKVERFIAR